MTAVKFNCPHCQQPIEAAPTKPGESIQCPACKRECPVPCQPVRWARALLLVAILGLLVAAGALVAYLHSNKYHERQLRHGIVARCQHQPGFKRMKGFSIIVFRESNYSGAADARYEFVNKKGGVEVGTLGFDFKLGPHGQLLVTQHSARPGR